jgi:hypothetical protein
MKEVCKVERLMPKRLVKDGEKRGICNGGKESIYEQRNLFNFHVTLLTHFGDFGFLNFHAAPEFGQIKRGKPFNFINDVAENKRLDG